MGHYTVAKTFDDLQRLMDVVMEKVKTHEEAFVATLEELQTSLNELAVAQEDAKNRTMEDVTELERQISELTAGQEVSQEQIDAMNAQVQSMKTNMESFDPVPTFPAPPPSP